MSAASMPFAGAFRVVSPYGLRTDPLTGEAGVWHNGVDLDVLGRGSDGEDGGAEVLAAAGGVVLRSRMVTDPGDRTSEWGNYVSVRGDDGMTVYYCHLAERFVEAGERVEAGRPVGVEGTTGRSTGIHLHFEVRGGSGESADPCRYLGIENRAGFVRYPEEPPGEWRAEASEWAREAVGWAVSRGILRGRGAGNYALGEPVTREELCVMLRRALGSAD